MTDFMDSGFGMGSAESRINSLTTRINKLETMAESGVPYDPEVARANPVANPKAAGVNPAQGQNFQAMMELMQAQMLSSGLSMDNEKDRASGIESIMNNPMFNMMLGGATGIPGIGAAQNGMGSIPAMGTGLPMNPMMDPMMNMNNGMPMNNGMYGMGSIDPALIQQMSETQPFMLE